MAAGGEGNDPVREAMIRHLRHAEIDKPGWDALLLASANRLWYAQSWVLDLANPGWEALADPASGAIMPLTVRSKYGVRYVFQPFGLQQLGVFAPRVDATLSNSFLAALPKEFRLVDVCLNEAMPVPGIGPWHTRPQRNGTMELARDVADLVSAYASNHKRNLKGKAPRIAELDDVDRFIQLYERTVVKRFGPFDRHGMRALPALIHGAIERQQMRVLGAFDGTDLIAAVAWIQWQGRSILFKSACDALGAEQRAMFHLVDAWIRERAGKDALLDFAGSNDDGSWRFYEGFGARASTYFRLRRNTLPAWLRRLKP